MFLTGKRAIHNVLSESDAKIQSFKSGFSMIQQLILGQVAIYTNSAADSIGKV